MLENVVLHRSPIYPTFTEDKDLNPYVVESAGFIPLEVKFKRFEQAGIRAQFNASEFTSSDYRDMYLGPNTEIYPGDDLETIEEKLILQEQFKVQILQEKAKLSNLADDKRSAEEVSSKVLDSSAIESVDKPLPSDNI